MTLFINILCHPKAHSSENYILVRDYHSLRTSGHILQNETGCCKLLKNGNKEKCQNARKRNSGKCQISKKRNSYEGKNTKIRNSMTEQVCMFNFVQFNCYLHKLFCKTCRAYKRPIF